MGWRVFGAAVAGKSHVAAGLPCQDAFAQEAVGDVLVAVVCDGAGSAAFSHEGAQFISSEVVRALSSRSVRGDRLHALSPHDFKDVVASVVGDVRQRLQAQAERSGRAFGDYAATLVGVVTTAGGGHFFHIGDGVAAAQTRSPQGEGGTVLSLPENGEYANETYFVTGSEWREHLRVTSLDEPLRNVLLMSDGAAPFVMARGNAGLSQPFVDPVVRYLAGLSPMARRQGDLALQGTLSDPRTDSITSDDKTLLMALWVD